MRLILITLFALFLVGCSGQSEPTQIPPPTSTSALSPNFTESEVVKLFLEATSNWSSICIITSASDWFIQQNGVEPDTFQNNITASYKRNGLWFIEATTKWTGSDGPEIDSCVARLDDSTGNVIGDKFQRNN